MPLIRCPKCGQAYYVPGVIAVRLPNSIATCECGEWLSGSKAALLARLLNPADIKEIDLKPYKVSGDGAAASANSSPIEEIAPGRPRSIRVVARGARESVNTVFTIGQQGLYLLLMVSAPMLITVLVTQTFVFAEYQALGIFGLLVDLGLFGLLRVAGEAKPDAFLEPDVA